MFTYTNKSQHGGCIRNHATEKGQSIILIAILMLVFVGFLALVIDGGISYATRRTAQNAADAGALAGVRELCNGETDSIAINRAREYAITRNKATDAVVDVSGKAITVTTSIPFNTFFGGFLGQPEMTASAVAAAKCYPPGGAKYILPVAWACKPPVGGSDSEDCSIQYGEEGVPGPTYLIMDSITATDDFNCQDPPNSGTPAGTLDCDLNDDGIDEVLSSGNRSWLDLDGGGGGQMVDWVEDGFPGKVEIHTWLSGEPGVSNNIFQAVDTRVGDIVVIPVFDRFCEGVPGDACPTLMDPEDKVVEGGGTSAVYFRVISFSAFIVTCVDAPPNGPCPYHDQAVDEMGIPDNTKTIEGYFIDKGYIPYVDGKEEGGIDVGVYTIYLSR
ncbi:MAG: hypothetical protein EHM70_17460 [Chloroflexota bacterium]|nr:MAG: hypothetical protein EHM70_17460 [Chloroflexota bacterium]